MSENTSTEKINVNRLSKKDQALLAKFRTRFAEVIAERNKNGAMALFFAVTLWKVGGMLYHLSTTSVVKNNVELLKEVNRIKSRCFDTVTRNGYKALVQKEVQRHKQAEDDQKVADQLQVEAVGEQLAGSLEHAIQNV